MPLFSRAFFMWGIKEFCGAVTGFLLTFAVIFHTEYITRIGQKTKISKIGRMARKIKIDKMKMIIGLLLQKVVV